MRPVKTSVFIIVIFLFLYPADAFSQENNIDSLPRYTFASVTEFWNQIDDICSDPDFSAANIGVVVQSLSNGEFFYKLNEDKLYNPASNLKLITTAAALNYLGKDYKYKTGIYSYGTQDGSILKGDLIVKGYGDPTISGRFYDDKILKIFQNWADSLLDKGIDEIGGNIIGDDNNFDDTGLGQGWAWDYESEWYSAPSGALSFNDNCVDFYIKPARPGEKAKIEFQPSTKYITVIQNVITVPADSVTEISVYRERKTNIITISGTIKENSPLQKCYSTVNNPTQYFVNVLKDVLIQKGIKVQGFGIDIDDLTEPVDYSRCRLLFTHLSPPLSVLLNITNKNSQNFFAEQLLKTIGYEKEHYGTAQNGIKWVKKYLDNAGINTENLVIVDGSGLSRLNIVSPKQIVKMLGYIRKQDNFKTFYNSLSIAGRDGTISSRMQKSRAENNVHAKSGFQAGVRCLSGYVETGDGELLAFSILINNCTIPMKLADNLQDLICIRLANFKRK